MINKNKRRKKVHLHNIKPKKYLTRRSPNSYIFIHTFPLMQGNPKSNAITIKTTHPN